MADIAEIGFRADSSELKEAQSQIVALIPPAKNLEKAAANIEKQLDKTGSAAAAAAAGISKVSSVTAAAAGEANRAATAVNQWATGYGKVNTTINATVAGLKNLDAHVVKYNDHMNRVVTNGEMFDAHLVRRKMHLLELGNSLKLTAREGLGFSRQFADIGVTAAMGMNPFMIAIQQGPQLFDILQEKAIATGQSIGTVFRAAAGQILAVLAPLAAWAIALGSVAAAAYYLWNRYDMLNKKADELHKTIGEMSEELDKSVGFMFGVSDSASMAAEGTSNFEANLKTATEKLANYNDLLKTAAVNQYALAAAKAQTTLEELRENRARQTNVVLGAEGIYEPSIDLVKMIGNAGKKGKEAEKQFLKDQEIAIQNVQRANERLAAAMNGDSSMFGPKPDKPKKPKKEKIDKIASFAEGDGLFDEVAYAAAKAELEFLKRMQEGEVRIIDERKYASARFSLDVVRDVEERRLALQQERDALGLNAEQTNALRIANDYLNEARRLGIELSPQEIAAIRASAGELAAFEAATDRAAQGLAFAKDATKGFLDDIRTNLAEGKSLWESFGSSVLNVLNKIADKLLDKGLDALFNPSSGGGAAGGIGGAIGKFFSNLFNAKGNAFDGRGKITAYAQGDVFSSPTVFNHAKGIGVLGEAGPEAVVPLKRGPDGSLGVSVNSKGGSTPPNVTVQVDNHFTITGAISSQDVIAMTRQSAEQTKQEIKRTLVPMINEFSQNGTLI